MQIPTPAKASSVNMTGPAGIPRNCSGLNINTTVPMTLQVIASFQVVSIFLPVFMAAEAMTSIRTNNLNPSAFSKKLRNRAKTWITTSLGRSWA